MKSPDFRTKFSHPPLFPVCVPLSEYKTGEVVVCKYLDSFFDVGCIEMAVHALVLLSYRISDWI